MQAIDRTEARQYLSSFNFRTFFTELMGWNAVPPSPSVKAVDSQQFSFITVAEKKGYTVLLCDRIPPYPVRAKLDRLVARDHFEHILIFADRASNRQIWQVSLREKGHPVKLREVPYRSGASGEELIQKLEQIAVPLEKEESTHLTDLTTAARAAFNERITKRFFRQFELEHNSFLKFLKGIPEPLKPWYVSVLINRLMFLYFMQSKSFLDGNPKYLTKKLAESKARKKDAFYRDFLCPLFFQGFAMKASDRPPAVRTLLGDIPYLNGGLFQKHSLELQAEEDGNTIVIPDTAFEKLFAFFEMWTWHLDTNDSADGDEIDPDVLGYIFEKYINQKQMGAYYTKEDITGYIAQNTILPFLFDSARQGCANAFEPNGAIWRMLRDDPDRYIYAAMRRGNETIGCEPRLTLPTDIAAGLANVSQRTGWNRTVPSEFADSTLPTESWREFIARRRRYDQLRNHIAAGEIHEVNDLITLNLDIRQVAIDAIQIAGSEDLVESFYRAIESVTILDPTCGSGAFLFAALELLQPLYDACLCRMQSFVEEAKSEASSEGRELHFNRFSHFRKTLDAAEKHVNTEYFILKTIIVKNLYGVDIMEEATEICKLRLFLKLVAQIDLKDKNRIEPLPDIDFNIRAGNTLVGYARYDDVKKAAESRLSFGEGAMARIDDSLQTLDLAVAQFRRQQTELGGFVTAEDKATLNGLYKHLESELDDFLAAEYGVKKSGLEKWKKDTKPFHWFCDFHAILERGGFDIVIGNPPYVEVPSEDVPYKVKSYRTIACGDLYAYVTERSVAITGISGYIGLIVPVSLVSTDGFVDLRSTISDHSSTVWVTNYAERPAKLFTGVEKRLSIALLKRGAHEAPDLHLSTYRRWTSEERTNLFATASYSSPWRPTNEAIRGCWPKVCSDLEINLLRKLSNAVLSLSMSKLADHRVLYTRKLRYFIQFLDFVPEIRNAKKELIEPSELKDIQFGNQSASRTSLAALNSSTFFWFFNVYSDVRNVNRREIDFFPFQPAALSQTNADALQRLATDLMQSFRENSSVLTINYKKYGRLYIQSFQPRESKAVIDEIDSILAQHYGFTAEELDLIVNYDIKYRMGVDTDNPGVETDS